MRQFRTSCWRLTRNSARSCSVRRWEIGFSFFSSLLKGRHTDKKEIQIFLIYKENKEIQSGAVAKSYMRKGFLIYQEMLKYFSI
jgi:hypothetical protein